MADRDAGITGFLEQAGWGRAERRHLAGDASDRRYERLRLGAATAVLMDNPPGGADDRVAFASMARHLRALGLSAPAILAEDLPRGLLLLEDLGDDLFARLLTADPPRAVRGERRPSPAPDAATGSRSPHSPRTGPPPPGVSLPPQPPRAPGSEDRQRALSTCLPASPPADSLIQNPRSRGIPEIQSARLAL